MKKWIGDRQVDSTKIDPTDTYTMTGLKASTVAIGNVNATSTDPLYVKTGSTSAMRLESTTTGKAYRITSDNNGAFNIFDITDNTNRLSIGPTGIVSIPNVVINTTSFAGLNVAGDATIGGELTLSTEGIKIFQGTPNYGLYISQTGANSGIDVVQSTAFPGIVLNQSGNAPALQINNSGNNNAITTSSGNVVITSGTLRVGGDASIIGNVTMGPYLYTGNSSLNIEPSTHLNLAPSTDLYLNPGSGVTTCENILIVNGDATISGILSAIQNDASVIGNVTMGPYLYTGNSSLNIEPFTHLNLAPSTDLYLNPGSNLTTCYSDFTCVGEIKTNNLILGANAFQNTGVVINSGALGVNNGDINGGQNFYLSKTAYITDTTTGHLYDSGDASIIGDIWMGSHLYTHQSLTIEPNTDLNLAPSTVLYLNPGSGDTTSYGNITIAGAKAGIALTCTAGNIVTAYDMSCGGALRGNGLWMNGYVGDTTDAVIGSRTFHFISGILTSIS